MPQPKLNVPKQAKLPPIRVSEALASVIFLMLARDERIKWTAEAVDAHVRNLIEYALFEHTLVEDDVVPF